MLRLSSSDWFGIHMLALVLAEFARLQPGVVVELLTDARLSARRRGRLTSTMASTSRLADASLAGGDPRRESYADARALRRRHPKKSPAIGRK